MSPLAFARATHATGPSVTTAVDDSSDPSQGDTAIESSGGSTGSEPDTMHLQHGTHATCDRPMWCVYGGDVSDPAGGPHAGQECFVSPYATSQITAIDYDVAAVTPSSRTRRSRSTASRRECRASSSK